MRKNWSYRLLALILALGCWYLVTGQEKVERWIEMPIEIVNAPKDLAIHSGLQTHIKVRVRGSKPMLRGLDERNMAYPLDFSKIRAGMNSLTIERSRVPVPKAVEVIEIDPGRLSVQADPLITLELPVEPMWRGKLTSDFMLTEASAEPARVMIQGPERRVLALRKVSTQPLEEEIKMAKTVVQSVLVDVPEAMKATPARVTVRFVFEEKTKDVWVKLPVEARIVGQGMDPQSQVEVKPEMVQLHVEVPLSLLRKKDFKKEFAAFVDIDSPLSKGWNVIEYNTRLPAGCTLLKAVPQKIEIQVLKK